MDWIDKAIEDKKKADEEALIRQKVFLARLEILYAKVPRCMSDLLDLIGASVDRYNSGSVEKFEFVRRGLAGKAYVSNQNYPIVQLAIDCRFPPDERIDFTITRYAQGGAKQGARVSAGSIGFAVSDTAAVYLTDEDGRAITGDMAAELMLASLFAAR